MTAAGRPARPFACQILLAHWRRFCYTVHGDEALSADCREGFDSEEKGSISLKIL